MKTPSAPPPADAQSGGLKTRRQVWWLGLVLCGLTLCAYWPVLQNDFINFDDPDYVTANPVVKDGLSGAGLKWAFTTGHAGNWHPLTWLSHMLDVTVFGLNPAGHHATSLLLHLINAVLLLLLMERLTGRLWSSAFIAALFALHPLHVESVAWVSERKDVLSGFFGLLCLLAYVHYAHESKAHPPSQSSGATSGPKAKVWYAVTLILFALGLMSKPMLVTWPFVMLLLDWWPLRRIELSTLDSQHSTLRVLFAEKLPFFALVIASSVVTFLVQKSGGATISLAALPLETRLTGVFAAYLRYLEKIFWPEALAIFYPYTPMGWGSSWVLGGIILVVGVTVAALMWRRRYPFLPVGWFWFLGTLVPVIGLVQVGEQAMADRYTYLPMIGLSIALVGFFAGPFGKWRPGPRVVSFVAAVLLVICGVLCCQQAKRWQNGLTLFAHTLAVTTNNATAHYNYGAALEAQGRVAEAVKQYEACIQIDPSRPADYHSLAYALVKLGRNVEAEAAYRKALELKPEYPLAQYSLATLLHQMGRRDEAEKTYRVALQQKPDYAAAYSNLGRLQMERGNYADAETQYRAALQLEASLPEAVTGLGITLAVQGKTAAALTYFNQAVALRPGDIEARLRLANALVSVGEVENARRQFAAVVELYPKIVVAKLAEGDDWAAKGQQAVAEASYVLATRLAPDDPGPHEKLGLFLAQSGRLAEALPQLQEVLRLRSDAPANYHLGLLLVALGRHAEAIPHYRRALEFNPDWPTALNDLAWLLATHPQAELRNGAEAIKLAERACALSGETEPRFWGTLDAAYAETGRFDEAIATAEKTRSRAQAASQTDVAKAAEERLGLYRNHQPYRQRLNP